VAIKTALVITHSSGFVADGFPVLVQENAGSTHEFLDNGDVYRWDGDSWNLPISNRIIGTGNVHIMAPADTALLAGDGQTKILTSATGFKSISIIPAVYSAITVPLIFSVSTTNADNAAIAALVNVAYAEYVTPTGVPVQDTYLIPAGALTPTVIDYDYVSTIKTLGIRIAAATGAVSHNVAVATVE